MHILEDDLKVCPCLYLLFQCFIFGTKIIIAITIFSHASPFYLAYRGQCLCYSGEFICAKHDTAKGSKKGGAKVQGKEEYFASSNKKHVVALNGIFLMYTCRIERNWRYVVGVHLWELFPSSKQTFSVTPCRLWAKMRFWFFYLIRIK